MVTRPTTYAASPEPAKTIFPLSDVRPGLKGECRTVFSGTKIDSFQFEVMGIGKNFAGPGRDVIWCKMLNDPTGQMVVAAGMSGSPCFIEGKNMGALAYGWSFNKDPIFGVQPIESMLELFEFKGNDRVTFQSSTALNRNSSFLNPSSRPTQKSELPSLLHNLAGFTHPMALSKSMSNQLVPIPLEVSGLNPLIADQVFDGLREAGFTPQLSAGGGSTEQSIPAELVPGSAVTGVIAQGDLNIAATGTLTWREGNKILAFGHPFLGIGAVDIPFGKAEIVGVVSSYERSMKLSNKGGIVGTLTQDRVSAVGGLIGPTPKLTPMTVTIRRPTTTKTYKIEFYDNKFFSPLVYQTALLQFLATTMENSEESTLNIRSEIELEKLPSLTFEDKFAGEQFSWVKDSIMLPAMQLLPIYKNDFGTPKIKSIQVEAEIQPVIYASELVEMTVDKVVAKAGDLIHIRAGFQPWHGDRFSREYQVKLPEDLKCNEIELVVADAPTTDQLLGNMGGTFGSNLEPQNLEQLITALNKRTSNNVISILLRKKSEGLYVQNQRLSGLPESVRNLLMTDASSSRPTRIDDTILSKTSLEFGSVVRGYHSARIRIQQ